MKALVFRGWEPCGRCVITGNPWRYLRPGFIPHGFHEYAVSQ